MEWAEINCIIEALEVLIEKYKTLLESGTQNEDDKSDTSNDLAYAEVLLGKYEDMRAKAAKD
ncbi:hypothetical protein [Dyella sp.]|uniref:hypothetical protein n=1 Tax=Dyella sp. TaxID=1869338 RepID=UPI002B49D9FD|nr:hypothetical protein [Dyella sp.]HKT27488.1 hypothetical protein [Dyella sp.]